MSSQLSRRSFLAAAAAAPLAMKALNTSIPIGLELYSVRNELTKNDLATVDEVAKIGYQVVEFYAPYYDWDTDHANEIRKRLDGDGLRCFSTHNARANFSPDKIGKAIELNRILGSRWMVMAHPGNVTTLDGWKEVADILNQANDTLSKHGMHAGYHNHDLEWKPIDGTMPLRLIADNTAEERHDAVRYRNLSRDRERSGRLDQLESRPHQEHASQRLVATRRVITSYSEKGSLRGRRSSPRRRAGGGVEYYLMEQEGSDYSEFETAKRCLDEYKKIHG